MQIELLNRRRWKTRVELANAIFDYKRDLPQPAATTLRSRLPHSAKYEKLPDAIPA